MRKMNGPDVVAKALTACIVSMVMFRSCIKCKCRMDRADVVAKALIEIHGERQLEWVVQALEGLKTEKAVQACVQVSQTLAAMDRPDAIADVRAGP
jgi:hypothetical protein